MLGSRETWNRNSHSKNVEFECWSGRNKEGCYKAKEDAPREEWKCGKQIFFPIPYSGKRHSFATLIGNSLFLQK